jgi:hypothetical protein
LRRKGASRSQRTPTPVESSLVQVLDACSDELRFGLLETIREFAQQEQEAD